jgi:prohibitin 2
MKAINSKVEQEQLRQAADNKLKTVESEQKQKVAIAEAEAAAVRATADGEAYARVKTATAEAEALKVQASAISANSQVLELRRITVQQTQAEKWNGALPSAIYAGAPIPFLQVK